MEKRELNGKYCRLNASLAHELNVLVIRSTRCTYNSIFFLYFEKHFFLYEHLHPDKENIMIMEKLYNSFGFFRQYIILYIIWHWSRWIIWSFYQNLFNLINVIWNIRYLICTLRTYHSTIKLVFLGWKTYFSSF